MVEHFLSTILWHLTQQLHILQREGVSLQEFPVGKIKEISYLRFDPGEMLLETLESYLKEKDLRDGIILSGVGSLSACRFHFVEGDGSHPAKNRFIEMNASIEINSLTGIIIDYEPHLHITVGHNNISTGGHLEHGCRVFTMVELSIAVMTPTKLTRRRTPEITGYHYKNLREI